MTANVAQRVADVRQRVEIAAKKSGRNFSDILILGVTKGVDLERISQAHQAGIRIFGENRLQEAREKITQIPAEWHMIGHLQSNKVQDAVSLFSTIQSVDSLPLAQKINSAAAHAQKTIPVFLEVNLSEEPQKYGFLGSEMYGVLDNLKILANIEVRGLMGIAPNTPDPALRRGSFRKLRSLFGVCRGIKSKHFKWQWLSMGMSDDFEIAIEEGSNMVRLGRVLFGERT